MLGRHRKAGSARGIAAAVLLLVALVAVPAVASATIVVKPAPSPMTGAVTPGPWALDFNVPTFGEAGCLVCHGDPRLAVVQKDGSVLSLWVDAKGYDHSIHGKMVSGKRNATCTDCHQNFNFKPPHITGDWKRLAKASCTASNCHGAEAATARKSPAANVAGQFEMSAHAVIIGPGGKADPKADKKPLCGDCHTTPHAIQDIDKDGDPAARAAMHQQSQQVCGRSGCHDKQWTSYNDYYHGVAYKTGATDAPACWDCHRPHSVLKAKDPSSSVNAANLGAADSCGNAACHSGSGAAGYLKMIHGRDQIVDENPIHKILASVLPWMRG